MKDHDSNQTKRTGRAVLAHGDACDVGDYADGADVACRRAGYAANGVGRRLSTTAHSTREIAVFPAEAAGTHFCPFLFNGPMGLLQAGLEQGGVV